MSNLSRGKYAQFISDRSGQAFPYSEMVIEWNGARVHTSEFEAKHPQLDPKPTTADGQGLRNARPQTFTLASGGGGGIAVDLTLPAPFSFSSEGMVPDDGSIVNSKREAHVSLGNVEITGATSITETYAVTVANPGSGNKYYIDGVQQATLNFIKTNSYKFDQSDSTNGAGGTHPLRFSTTSDGTHNSGTEYTTGVVTSGTPGQPGSYTLITVDASAPSTLYYYCSNHSGMGGQINIS